MVVVPKIYVRTVVPINVVGTTVHINSLKIGKIKTLSKFVFPGEMNKKNILWGAMATFSEC